MLLETLLLRADHILLELFFWHLSHRPSHFLEGHLCSGVRLFFEIAGLYLSRVCSVKSLG